jgi:hypothetical protein
VTGKLLMCKVIHSRAHVAGIQIEIVIHPARRSKALSTLNGQSLESIGGYEADI